MSKKVEFIKELLETEKNRKESISNGLTIRKLTVKRYWDLLASMKGVLAEFSRKGKSTGAIRALYQEKLQDLKDHEQMVVSLKYMYSEACEKVWLLEGILKDLEGN